MCKIIWKYIWWDLVTDSIQGNKEKELEISSLCDQDVIIPAVVIEMSKKSRFGKIHGQLSYGMEHLENVWLKLSKVVQD